MNVTITPSDLNGSLPAIASKSMAHRILLCAAFADQETMIRCEESNEDICATVRCLNALGATIIRKAPYYHVTPLKEARQNALLDCGESGSTLRFLLPIVAMLGANASFQMAGRLPERPLSPLREELERCGVYLSPPGSNPCFCRGTINKTDFSIPGNVSSQFISGLLFALATAKKVGTLNIEGTLESAPYIDLTIHTLRCFGVSVLHTPTGYAIEQNAGITSPGDISVEGDWSNAAFPLCAGVLGKHPVTLTGLNLNSQQGDRAIVSLLQQFGAVLQASNDQITAFPGTLHGIEIDASQIPDLVPILATVAAVAQGKTVIKNAERLRIKESNRLLAICTVLTALGAKVNETSDGLCIEGVPSLGGGTVSSFGDHRIAMSAAIASLVCRNSVTIEHAEVTAKSYPAFWHDMQRLGMNIQEQSSSNFSFHSQTV